MSWLLSCLTEGLATSFITIHNVNNSTFEQEKLIKDKKKK